MSFFGLTDPYIVASYIGCFITVILCCAVGLKVKKDSKKDEGDAE